MARKAKGTLPSGNVRYRLYVGQDPTGKKLYKSFTAPRKSDAMAMAERWREEHSKQPLDASNLSFSEAANDFLAKRSRTLSPSTYRSYMGILRTIEANYPQFARTRMQTMSSELVQDLINSLTTRLKPSQGKPSGKTISPKTVINYFAFVQTVLQTQGIELHNIKLPQKRKPELTIPENDTVRSILELIKGTELEVPVLLAAWGPMRRGEICALRLEDIDFASNTVHVCRNMVLTDDQEWTIKAPKTTAGDRYITYPSYVIDLIRRRGYVVHGTPNNISHNFRQVLDRHGYDHIRFHDLRHFAASFQIALGIPPEYVMERGGWHSPGTMQRYVHALDQQRRAMADKANEAFSALM